MARSSVPTVHKNLQRGTWEFSFDSIHPKPDGSRRRIRRRGFPTAGAAKDALRELLEHDGRLGSAPETVGQVLDTFLARKRLQDCAPGTISHYEWAADIARLRWGSMQADQLGPQHLDAAYAEILATGRAPRTVAALHTTIKAAYALAVSRGAVLRNPADLATKPRVRIGDQKRSWWEPEEMARFLAYVAQLDDAGTNPLPRALIEVLIDTGGRRGETLALRWADIDLNRSIVWITRQLYGGEMRPTKRARAKSGISITRATLDALKARRTAQAIDREKMGVDWPRRDHRDHDLVFTWADGRALDPSYVTRTITRMSLEAGLPRLTPHGLRHSFATAALAAGVPVEVVAHRLGNTTRVVQEVYAHAIPAEDADAAERVAALFRPGVSPSSAPVAVIADR